ncbi:lipopolysaccharide biosynthesis protein [Calothrix sp. NIES-4071]|nr:lipopolysaccharide biosynthesis protein [Calothrix sp. NIES-4071]BAZ64018.1 lipopolysaccharide biosynthesis protein [Calothrix sp. NIES-4105]
MAINGVEQEQLATISSLPPVDIRQLFKILLRRRFLILGVTGIVMSAAGILAILAKPNYQSSMQLLVQSNLYTGAKLSSNQTDANNDTGSNVEVVDYNAQSQLMLSNQLIEKAVAMLRPDYPDIKFEDIKGTKGKKSPLTVARVESGSTINRTPSHQVFEIKYKNHDPIKTKRVLQMLLKVYRDYNIEQQKQRLTKGMAFVDERLPKVKSSVVTAEDNLEAFRKKNNILDPEAQSKIILETLAETQKQLQTTRAQLQNVQARYAALQQKLAVSPSSAMISSRLSQSTRYQTLLNEIQKTELALARERIRYTDNSPVVQKLVQQRENQLGLLRQEITRTLADQTGKKASQLGNSEIDAAVNQALNQSTSNESLLNEGQMAEVDIKLTEEMIQVQTIVQGLEANEKSLSQSEKRLQSELGKYPGLIAEYNRLLPEVQTNRKTLEQLMQAQQSLSLKLAQGGFDWQMLEAPERGVYIGSGRKLILSGGAVAAPIIGIVVALILEMLNDSIYTSHELQRITNLRLLGIVPKLTKNYRRKRTLLPAHSTSALLTDSPVAVASLLSHENLDMAYQNIQILNLPLPYKSLMVTSACFGEGKSTVTLGLAVSSARTHHRVLIIDANLREPSLHKYLELQNEWGLSLLLVDEAHATFKDYIQPIHPSIDVLTAGPFLEDTVKLLSSRRMKELLNEFEQSYDLVLVDAPPILSTVDARILATLCNAIVIVARLGQITRAELAQTTEILENLNLIGIIANQATNI